MKHFECPWHVSSKGEKSERKKQLDQVLTHKCAVNWTAACYRAHKWHSFLDSTSQLPANFKHNKCNHFQMLFISADKNTRYNVRIPFEMAIFNIVAKVQEHLNQMKYLKLCIHFMSSTSLLLRWMFRNRASKDRMAMFYDWTWSDWSLKVVMNALPMASTWNFTLCSNMISISFRPFYLDRFLSSVC